MDLRITDSLTLRGQDLHFRFVHAPGPGGQNVNKVATAVQLRFDTAALAEPVRSRALALAGKRATRKGWIVIEARRYRSQERNREDALERLAKLLQRATRVPKARKKTRVSPTQRRKRVVEKRRQGQRKSLRKPPPAE